MTGWWKAITKNTHNADWVSDLVEVENSIGSEDTADVTADDLLGKKIFSKFYQKTNNFVPIHSLQIYYDRLGRNTDA